MKKKMLVEKAEEKRKGGGRERGERGRVGWEFNLDGFVPSLKF
jgi:hypothetical protein